ncbi:MAG: hypothetical protein NUV57_06395 [archaeon]|nr:hypothetical protein [archaeon]
MVKGTEGYGSNANTPPNGPSEQRVHTVKVPSEYKPVTEKTIPHGSGIQPTTRHFTEQPKIKPVEWLGGKSLDELSRTREFLNTLVEKAKERGATSKQLQALFESIHLTQKDVDLLIEAKEMHDRIMATNGSTHNKNARIRIELAKHQKIDSAIAAYTSFIELIMENQKKRNR